MRALGQDLAQSRGSAHSGFYWMSPSTQIPVKDFFLDQLATHQMENHGVARKSLAKVQGAAFLQLRRRAVGYIFDSNSTAQGRTTSTKENLI